MAAPLYSRTGIANIWHFVAAGAKSRSSGLPEADACERALGGVRGCEGDEDDGQQLS